MNKDNKNARTEEERLDYVNQELNTKLNIMEMKESAKAANLIASYVDCRFQIEKEHLPEKNRLSEIFNQWGKNICIGDFFITDLYIGVDFWDDLPCLCVTDNPKKYNIKIPIEKTEMGANGKFFFEPHNQVWYEEEQANADYNYDLYRVDFVVTKLFTEIHFQCAIGKIQ